jgi:hypothetical protein
MGLLLAACNGGGDGDPTGTGEGTSPTDSPTSPTDEPTSPGTVTSGTGVGWHGEAEPIVRDACLSCHQEGGVGFSLATYEDAQPWAQAIASAVSDGRMPPWLVNDDGTCQDWSDSRSLTDDEIATLVAWADDGALRGDPALSVSEPLPEPATLERVDLRLDTPEIVPEIEGDLFAPNDEYRCFVFKDLTEADTFITGFQVDPGFDAIVHHVIGMPVDPDRGSNRSSIESQDGADGRPGWDCLGTAGEGISEEGYPVTWAPGMGAVHYPEGTGVRLASNHWFVIQVHYNLVDPANRDLPDSTGLELMLDDEVDDELYFSLADGLITSAFYGWPDTIPPGEEAYDYTWELDGDEVWLYANKSLFTVGGTEYKLWGVMPHMHQRGTKQYATVERGDGTDECLVDVPLWDFEWQLTYFYEEPLDLAFSDRLSVTCTYDTTDEEAPLLPGWGTNNEMCLLVMIISK